MNKHLLLILKYPIVCQLIANIGIAILSFGVITILGRVLGVENFGEYTFYVTIGSLFLIVQESGYKTLIYREYIVNTKLNATFQLLEFAVGHILCITILGIIACLSVFYITNTFGYISAILVFASTAFCNLISAKLRAEGFFFQILYGNYKFASLAH